MKDIDLVKLKESIALRKGMPGFGPDTSIDRLRIINATKDSFTPDVVEALIDQLEAAQRARDESSERLALVREQRDSELKRNTELEAELKRRDDAVPVAWILHARGGDQLTQDGGYVANAEGISGIGSTPLYAAAPAAVFTPEKVVKLPAEWNGTEHSEYGAGQQNGWNDLHGRVLSALDAAGVKWVEGE